MNNVTYADFNAQKENCESRIVDLEKGYVRLSNTLYEALIGADLTKNQAKVAHAICRKTYGFNKDADRITDVQISELTHLPRQKVNKAKNELIAMKVIVKNDAKIGINKNILDWSIANYHQKSGKKCHQNSVTLNVSLKQGQCHYNDDNIVTKTGTHSSLDQGQGSVTKTVTKSVTKTMTTMSPKQGHTKDNIKYKRQKYINPLTPLPPQKSKFDPLTQKPDNVSAEIWTDWVVHRREIRHALTPTVCKRIRSMLENHVNPDAVITLSLERGWQGLFPEKITAPAKAKSTVDTSHLTPEQRRKFEFYEFMQER